MSTRSTILSNNNMASSPPSSSPPSSPTRSRSSSTTRPMKYMTSVIPCTAVRNDVEGYTSLSHFNVLNSTASFIDNAVDDDDNINAVHRHTPASVRLSISINDKNKHSNGDVTEMTNQQRQQRRRQSSITVKTTNTKNQQQQQQEHHHRRHAKSWVEQANRLPATKKLNQSKNQFKASKQLDIVWDDNSRNDDNKNPQEDNNGNFEERKQLKDDFDYWDDYVDELSVYHERRLAETSSSLNARQRLRRFAFVMCLAIAVAFAGGVYAAILDRDEEMEDVVLSSDSSSSSLYSSKMFVPPVPSTLSTLCSSPSILSWDAIARCEELCQKAPPCCTSRHSNCYESHEDACASYATHCLRRRKRRSIRDLSRGGEVKESIRRACRLVDVPTDGSNGGSTAMMTMSRDECFAACTPASCCFSGLFGLDEEEGGCEVEEMEWCGLYVRCGVLETVPLVVATMEEDGVNATTTTTTAAEQPPSLPISVPDESTTSSTTTTTVNNDSVRNATLLSIQETRGTPTTTTSLGLSNSIPTDNVGNEETLLQEDENEITKTTMTTIVTNNNVVDNNDTELEQTITLTCAMSNILFSKEGYKACQDICSQRDEDCADDDDVRRKCQLYQSCHNLKNVIH